MKKQFNQLRSNPLPLASCPLPIAYCLFLISSCPLPLASFLFLLASCFLPLSSKAQTIAGGGQHSLAICSDGTVMSWGYNRDGQLGIGNTMGSILPIQVQSINGIKSLSSGWEHSIALANDGTIWAWGYNGFGQLGNEKIINSFVPVQVNSLTEVSSIGSGHLHTHSLAVKSDGSGWAWGRNVSGQIGDGSKNDSNIPIQIHGPNDIGFLTDVKSLAGGHDYSTALKNDGTVWSWGANSFGQLGDNSLNPRLTPVQVQDISDVVAIAVGDWSTLALKNDSTVWAWGYNGSGRLGDNTNISKENPVQVVSQDGIDFLTGIIAIAAGESHELALRKDGTVWAWGKNLNGQLGDNSTLESWTPVQVNNQGGTGFLKNIIAIAGGARHSLALDKDGFLWAWGDNSTGQLGDGTYTERHTPVLTHIMCKIQTSIKETDGQNSFTLYPNPYNGKISIELLNTDQHAHIEIFNLIGETVFKKIQLTNPITEIDIENISAGVYIVRVTIGTKQSSKKIIIQ